jgi:phage replication initiation protein
MAAEGTFSPVSSGEKPVATGPGSNTGQKGGALIDYLTIVVARSRCEERGLSDLRNLCDTVFGFRGEVFPTAIRDKRWQFYEQSAVLVDREGEMVGRIGVGGNGDSICISLSGAGTKWVRNWHAAAKHLGDLRARISRVDLAFDDYEGKCLDLTDLRMRARNREFMQGGTPPKFRFLDDEGNGTGCTLYVGGKGHKELCVYEKGKQLGIAESPWLRAEVRLYGKHVEVPMDTLTNPLAFLRGSYDVLALVLAEVVDDACTRLKTKHRQVEHSAEALVRYARRQFGPSLNLFLEAFGGSFADFLEARIVREGQPARFKGIAKGAHLAEIVRKELCHSSE